MTASSLRDLWALQPGVTYLNHGSFGPSPRSVLAAQQEWQARLAANPVDFFVRNLEGALDEARDVLADFIGTKPERLLFVDNATFGMNFVAHSLSLAAGDEVLLTDHEYGAVIRIWRNVCQRTGAELKSVRLPEPMTGTAAVVEAVTSRLTPRTRVLVVSHVTSPTAIILPVWEICAAVRRVQPDVLIVIDGPHAPAALPLRLEELSCDYYTASLHKWLSAPCGSGFLYVHPRRQQALQPLIVSWGASLSGRPVSWRDEYTWLGTRDPSACLAVPAAIDFLRQQGADHFRQEGHRLAQLARHRLSEVTGIEPFIPESSAWYGPMVAVPLGERALKHAEGHLHPVQQKLWEQAGIEVPVTRWRSRYFLRVSCHLYNTQAEIELLAHRLPEVL